MHDGMMRLAAATVPQIIWCSHRR